MIKKLAAVAIGLTLMATLGACGSSEDAEFDRVMASAEAQLEKPDYKDTYKNLTKHLSANYGILESAELCDELDARIAKLELKEFETEMMKEAKITFKDEQLAHDAAYDALWDWCNPEDKD